MLEEVAYMRYDEEKLAELILYVAEKIQSDRTAGATKLNKYLYFADFSAVRKLGHPITGAEYQRLRHGPAPRRLPPSVTASCGTGKPAESVARTGWATSTTISSRNDSPGRSSSPPKSYE